MNPARISQMTGQHRENIKRLTAELDLKELKIRPAALKNDEILLLSVEIG